MALQKSGSQCSGKLAPPARVVNEKQIVTEECKIRNPIWNGFTKPLSYTLYSATADPVTVGSTGQRSFCSVEDAVVRFDSSGTKPADHGACQALGALN